MAPPVYSLRIFSHAGLTSGAGRVGPVVPAGFIYILRDIDVVELTLTSGAELSIVNPTLGPLLVFVQTSSTALQNQPWRGRQVYSPGEQIGFQAVSGTWAIMASGYQLTLP